MFTWRRPDGLPRRDPTEDAIWAAIDEHDPHGTALIEDRLEQYHDMLRGRDALGSSFIRSPLLPACELDPDIFAEPPHWITTLKLKCSEFNALEKSVDYVSSGLCDILEPAADIVGTQGRSSLLAHRLLQPDSRDWPRDSSLGQPSRPASGYVTWARYILRTRRDVLRRAGVYEAVYASLFRFDRLPYSWLRGVVEFWDPTTNTCWMGSEELTLTLWELQAISGLPILGRRYEECVPSDEELFQRCRSRDGGRRGESVLPAVLPRMLRHFRSVRRGAGPSSRSRAFLSVDTWIRSFVRDECMDHHTASLYDPFGFDLSEGVDLVEEFAEPISDLGYVSPLLSGVDEEVAFVGFLVTWLCTFVLPSKGGHIRASALLMASQISCGCRVSLAPAVLGRIYRVLGALSTAVRFEIKDVMP